MYVTRVIHNKKPFYQSRVAHALLKKNENKPIGSNYTNFKPIVLLHYYDGPTANTCGKEGGLGALAI